MNKKSDISGPHGQPQNTNAYEMEILGDSRTDLQVDQGGVREMRETRGTVEPSIFNQNDQEKSIKASEHYDQSRPSSIISNGLGQEVKAQNQGCSNKFATPGAESRSDLKSTSTFENSDQFSGARENHYTSNYSTNEKKVQFTHYEVETQSQAEDCSQQALQHQKMKANTQFLDDKDTNYQAFSVNQSTQKETRQTNERVRRSCRDKTSKYSLTHKGMYTNIQTADESKQPSSRMQNYRNNSVYQHSTLSETPLDKNRLEGFDDQTNIREGQSQVKPVKKSTPRTHEQCLKIIQDMLAFDWSLKDIANLRHSPSLQYSQMPFDEFALPILQNLKPNNNINKNKEQEEQKDLSSSATHSQQPNQNEDQSHSAQIDQSALNHISDMPSFIQTLFREKRLKKFKKIFRELQDKAVQDTFKEPAEQILNQTHPEEQDLEMQMNQEGQAMKESEVNKNMEATDESQMQERKFKIMLELLRRDVRHLESYNLDNLQLQFSKLQEAYNKALTSDLNVKDMEVYRPDEMDQYGLEFLMKIEPLFVQDLQKNMDWFKENYNEILLNVGQPSKLEKDFLRHIEFVQQKKSDIKYKKILKYLENGKRSGQLLQMEEDKYQGMSSNKRTIVTQEDAQCAICNNGDYEDEDLIVFCGNCNVPVHQSCYGIEQLPEGDWICYNCEIFGFKRGLLVNCLLCPKKGGAMKPTNIFTSVENFKRYNQSTNSSSYKKSAKKSQHNFSSATSEKLGQIDGLVEKKFTIGENEDKNLSLSVILHREFDYQSNLRLKIEKLKDQGEIEHKEIELHFDQNEKEMQTPEDYSFFLQRNETRMENYEPTQTLYEWVHLSCATWIPGPVVTPKTPVRLNKFEEKRFHLQCIICLKKGGACMQCQFTRCTIAFHVECARRGNYCMEIERKERDKSYRMFCEKHRPLKIVKEIEERDKQTVEEIQKFCKIIDKCMDIDLRYQMKPRKHHDHKEGKDHSLQKPQLQSSSLKKSKDKSSRSKETKSVEKAKKWREKDKKMLFERVKEKYLLFRKMRINVVRVDPFKKVRKSSKNASSSRKRSKKRSQKKVVLHKGGCRAGLRSKDSHLLEESQDLEEDKQEDYMDSSIQNQMEQSESLADQTLAEEDQEDIHYKLAIPVYPTEMDWTITLSRNDFPWYEIKFGGFSAKDCYDKYSSVVKDAQIFLKKVLGLKEKYKKMMQNQIALGPHNQMNGGIQQSVPAQDNSLYCVCKGEVASDFYVKCDGDDECQFGGWVHPVCSEELKEKGKQELDEMEEWYCEGCKQRISKEDQEEEKDPQQDDDDDEENQDQEMEEVQEDEGQNNEEESMRSSSSSSSDSEQDQSQHF